MVYHLVFQAIMEDLSVMWKKFLLSEKEESEYIGQIFETTGGKVLAAKFFTRRVFNMEAIARTFKQLWQTKKSFEIKDMGNHVVLFVFSDKMDADKVLLGESLGAMINTLLLCGGWRRRSQLKIWFLTKLFSRSRSMTYQWRI